MKRRFFGKAIALLLVLTMCFGLMSGCKPQENGRTVADYTVEKNDIRNAELYPYVIRTPHATWYLAAADIELLGEEAFFEGLEKLLTYQEADFADAIAALDGYLSGDIPVVDIWTDFSNRTEVAKTGDFGALCHWDLDLIYLYNGFEMTGYTLLHEYVHYLTHNCCSFEIKLHFWSEAIAEYVSMFVCRNRMYDSVLPPNMLLGYATHGALDENGEPDQKKWYYTVADVFRDGSMNGENYLAVNQSVMTMTEQQREHPAMLDLSYYEAACFFQYLVENYGEEYVYTHMNCGWERFEKLFGKDFETLFFEWAEYNHALCDEYGLN